MNHTPTSSTPPDAVTILREICDMQAENYGNAIDTHIDLIGLAKRGRIVLAAIQPAGEAAPIEAGELPLLPEKNIVRYLNTGMEGIGHNDESMQAYGQLCRATKPESVTGGATGGIAHGYTGGTCTSHPDGGATISLHYETMQQGEAAFDTIIARTAPTVDAVSDNVHRELAGWKDEAAARQRMIDGLRAAANLRHQHDTGDVWFWQGDGTDHPESMSNGMAVVLRADHLRAMLSGCNVAVVVADAMRVGVQGKASDAEDAARLDWLEAHCTGASDSERYLPFRVYWGNKGATKGIRAVIDKQRATPTAETEGAGQ
jgi:hypothetical protein